MSKRGKWSKAYTKYRNKFYIEKRIGNVKQGVRVLSPNQYRRARKENLSDKKILKAQTLLHSKAEKNELWNYYKKIRVDFNRGESLIQENTYFGETDEDLEGLSYHYNISGLLKDKDAMHFIISYRINDGEEREEVLADYGY